MVECLITPLSWQTEMIRWGTAESATVRQEEFRGLHRIPISLEWDQMLETFKAIDLLTTPTSEVGHILPTSPLVSLTEPV